MTKNKKMKTEDIISRLNEDWRQLLSIYPELTEDGKKQAKSAINEIISSLKSMRDEKEEIMDDVEIMRKYGVTEKDVQDYLKQFQSSPQPQPGRGVEEILADYFDGVIPFNEKIDITYNAVIQAMEEYRTQSEGKDMYPKEFVEWIKLNCYSKRGGFSSGKIWGIIGDESNIFYGTPELFNHWSINHK